MFLNRRILGNSEVAEENAKKYPKMGPFEVEDDGNSQPNPTTERHQLGLLFGNLFQIACRKSESRENCCHYKIIEIKV